MSGLDQIANQNKCERDQEPGQNQINCLAFVVRIVSQRHHYVIAALETVSDGESSRAAQPSFSELPPAFGIPRADDEDFGESKRGDGEVISAQTQAGRSYQQSKKSRRGHRRNE